MKDNRNNIVANELPDSPLQSSVPTGIIIDNEPYRGKMPDYWKKKKLSPEFLQKLKDTAKREVLLSDEFGEYKEGTFLHRNTVVTVLISDGLWALNINCKHPVPLHVIREVRYKYLPNDMLIVQLFPSREELEGDTSVILYQIPGSFMEDSKEDAI